MSQKRQRRTAKLKARLAIEALKGEKSLSKLSNEYDIDPRQITRWKNILIDSAENIFENKNTQNRTVMDIEKQELRRRLNEMMRNVDYLKKRARKVDPNQRKDWIEIDSEESMSITQQCALLSVPRSSYYYQPVEETPLNCKRQIDPYFLQSAFAESGNAGSMLGLSSSVRYVRCISRRS